jgi:uncharacterized protein YraI
VNRPSTLTRWLDRRTLTALVASTGLVTAVVYATGTNNRPPRPVQAVADTTTTDAGVVTGDNPLSIRLYSLSIAQDGPAVNDRPFAAASGTIDTDGRPVNVRSGSDTSYGIVASLADGRPVTIYCVKRGETVNGVYGASTWWDKIDDDAEQYVADALVYTGTFDPVAPLCDVGSSAHVINPDNYPYASWNWDTPDGNSYYARECVSFVAWAVHNDGIPDRSNLTGLGDAWMWGRDTRTTLRYGYDPGLSITRYDTPQQGDIAYWDKGRSGYPIGHVAYIAGVSGHTAHLYEYNEQGDHLLRTDRWIDFDVPTAFFKL